MVRKLQRQHVGSIYGNVVFHILSSALLFFTLKRLQIYIQNTSILLKQIQQQSLRSLQQHSSFSFFGLIISILVSSSSADTRLIFMMP